MASKQILEEIRSRVSIAALVGERVPLKRSGHNFKGLCPFHQEKTPSFMVSEEKQIFHCFGCAAGGDVFTFLMKMDGLSFQEALADLAKRAGVTLPAEKQAAPGADAEWVKRKQWSQRVNEIANAFFKKNFADEKIGKNIREYIQGRGIRLETASQHGLGFADKSWDALLHALNAAKVPLALVQELGLIKEREKNSGYYDFFRNRLMFPILDAKGEIVGFSGRTLDPEDGAKYLNSPDSILYNKSKTLFGLHWAKEAIRKQDEVILVEGNLDLLSLRQAGIENVVAPLGTALTVEHLKLLMRHTRNFVIAFDSDAAGIAAAMRALPLFLELELVPKALILPNGMDPDNFMRQEGIAGWEKLQKKSLTLFEFFIDDTIAKAGKGTAAVVNAWEKIKPMLQKVVSPVEQGIYRQQVAQKLRVDEGWLKKGPQTQNNMRATSNEQRITKYPEEERLLIAAMVLKPNVVDAIKEAGDIFTNPELKDLATQLFSAHAEEGTIHLAATLETLDEKMAGWVREMALVDEADQVWEKAVGDCLTKIRAKSLISKLAILNQEIAVAEGEGNETTLLKLLTEKAKLTETKRKDL